MAKMKYTPRRSEVSAGSDEQNMQPNQNLIDSVRSKLSTQFADRCENSVEVQNRIPVCEEENSGNDHSPSNDKSSWNTTCEESSSESITHVNLNVNKTSGNSASGTSYLKNAILDEVLNKKKMALLQSREVINFLYEQQVKKRSQH